MDKNFVLGIISYYTPQNHKTAELKKYYTKLESSLLKKNIKVARVNLNDYIGKKKFKKFYYTQNEKFELKNEEVNIDLLWDKTSQPFFFIKDYITIPVFPSIKIKAICRDKYETYKYLKNLQPKTRLLYEAIDILKKTQRTIPHKVVAKPIRSNGGKGIKILNKREIPNYAEKLKGFEKMIIIQEFINFKNPDNNTIKEIRVISLQGKIVGTYIRVAPVNEFRVNIGSGGSKEQTNTIPRQVKSMIKKIRQALKIEKEIEFMSMDFGYDYGKKRRLLLEINSSPALHEGMKFDKIASEIHKLASKTSVENRQNPSLK